MTEAAVARRRLRPRLPVAFDEGDFLSAIRGHEPQASAGSWPPDAGRAFLVTSGRAALWLLLRSLGLRKGARVGVPLFCCEAVFEAIERCGCTPAFLDVDPETLVLDQAGVTDGGPFDGLIAVHLFGNPVDITRLAVSPGIPVIEDCAHSIFGEIHGRTVGTFGVGTMYSFGLGKPVSLGRLGAAVPRGQEAVARIEELHRDLPSESPRGRISRAVMSRLVAALYREPWYGMFAFKVAQHYESSVDPMGKEATEPGAVPPNLRGIVLEKVERYRETLSAQRETWRNLADTVTDASSGRLVPQHTTEGCVSDRWLFAMRCPSAQDRDRFVDALAREGVDSMKFYDRVPAIARDRFGYRGGCQTAEALCKSVVVVPVRVPTERDGGEKVADALSRAIRSAR